MPSGRIQRRIDQHLNAAEEAGARLDWAAAKKHARAALSLDVENKDAGVLLASAESRLTASPPAPTVSVRGVGGRWRPVLDATGGSQSPAEEAATVGPQATASTALSLVEAKEHIDAAKSLINEYINAEPVPDPFGLAMLEGLLGEVDILGDQLEAMLNTQTVTPLAEERAPPSGGS